jgi:hypothetical protein
MLWRHVRRTSYFSTRSHLGSTHILYDKYGFTEIIMILTSKDSRNQNLHIFILNPRYPMTIIEYFTIIMKFSRPYKLERPINYLLASVRLNIADKIDHRQQTVWEII